MVFRRNDMALVRWNAFNDLAGLEIDGLNRMFSDLYQESTRAWVPPVDIYETETHEVAITAEPPELQEEEKDDIRITGEHGVRTRAVDRKHGEVKGGDQFERVERRHGTFSRAFTLPDSVDAAKIAASYKDGVLTIRLPRREETKPK